jgi:hypothetical protein
MHISVMIRNLSYHLVAEELSYLHKNIWIPAASFISTKLYKLTYIGTMSLIAIPSEGLLLASLGHYCYLITTSIGSKEDESFAFAR